MSDFRVDEGKTSITPGYEWDISNAYERNTIVSNLGSAYMSVQDVPVNTAISDTDYWMKVLDGGVYVTPEMFGAKGDGVADDSDALQEAINLGMPICLVGNYKVTETLNVDVQRTRIFGMANAVSVPRITYSGTGSRPVFPDIVSPESVLPLLRCFRFPCRCRIPDR